MRGTAVPGRLRASQLAVTREQLLSRQGGVCALCRTHCTSRQAVLDHDHKTGAIRAALHRGCNALLGKAENNHARCGVPDVLAWADGIGAYMRAHLTNQTGMLHPSHRTPEEKRIRRNAAARKRRATKRRDQ
jgi:hypothetical protein